MRDGWPERIEITAELRARCAMAGLPEPTAADATECLAWHQSAGRRSEDWGASLVRWMGAAKRMRDAAPRRPQDAPASPEQAARLATWREAYAAGVAAGKGGPFAASSSGDADLADAVRAHGKRWRTGNGEPIAEGDIPGWLRAKAEDFARWVTRGAERDVNMPAYYNGFQAKGFVRWLNETNTGALRAAP